MRNHLILGAVGAIFLTASALAVTGGRGISQQGTFLQSGTGATLRTIESKLRDEVHVKDFGAVCDGVADDQPAIAAAIVAGGKGDVRLPDGTCRLASTLTIPSYVTLKGAGSTDNTGSTGATVLLKDFNGQGVILTGDNSGMQDLQVNSSASKTGDGIQIKASRAHLIRVAVTSMGRDGIRIGDDEVGAESFNANLWRLDHVGALYNTRHGLYIHTSNTSTSGTFPQGNSDVGGGLGTALDLRSNGGDGLKARNAIDNRFDNVLSQNNTGWGAHFEQDCRSHHISGLYTETNGTGDLFFDTGSSKNVIWGMNFIAIQTITDNGTSNLIWRWDGTIDAWVPGKGLSVYDKGAGGLPYLKFYAETNGYNTATLRAGLSGTGGLLELQTRNTSGGANSSKILIDDAHHVFLQDAGFAAARSTLTYSASMTPDGTAGNTYTITATNGTAFTINAPSPSPYIGGRMLFIIRNASGGALGAITWNAIFKINATAIAPANATSRSIEFYYDGTNLVEIFRGALDVPN